MLNLQFSSSSSKMKKKEKNRTKSSPAQVDLNIIDPTKKKQSPRSPLQDLNAVTRTNSSNSSSTSIEAPRGCLRFFLSNSSSSSKTPLHHLPKSLTKSHKSAPYSGSSSRSKPSKENLPKPTSQRFKKNPPCLYQWQSGKKSTPTTAHKPNPSSGSQGFTPNQKPYVQQQQQSVVRDDASEPTELFKLPDVENCTPVAKLACGPALHCANDDKLGEEDSASTTTTATKTTTPPVQSSVSPEIQCQLSSMLVSEAATTTTPACYGAGHHLSGVTDKRKCKPRGILTIGDDHLRCGTANDFDTENANDFDTENNAVENLDKSRVSLVPLPAEATMHWLVSPCDEEDKHQQSDPAKGSCQIRKLLGSTSPTQHLSSSPSAVDGFPSYACNNANCSGIITNKNASKNSRRRSRITLLSPNGLPEFQGFTGPASLQVAGCLSSPSPPVTPTCKAVMSQDERKYRYNSTGANSPLAIDLLGSGNVIQTPQSDSSSDKHVGTSWFNADDDEKQYFDSELDITEECLGRASLSPKSHTLLWDLPGLIFPFTELTSPSSSIDFSHFQKTWDNCASCDTDSTFDNVSQSHLRISWRDGLMSRICEMDELDFCRCLSDDENDINQCINNQLKSHPSHELNFDLESGQIFNNGFGSPEFVGHERRIDGLGKEKYSLQIPNSCAESICTDGGDLAESGDSDWTLCYKNLLFQV